MIKKIANTAVGLVVIAAGLFGFKNDHKPLNVRVKGDVVSVSESPRHSFEKWGVSFRKNEPQKQKFKEGKLRTTQSVNRLRRLGHRATPKRAKVVAWILVGPRGWRGHQWQCLTKLWEEESGWRWNASNPTSGAGGIPQSLPARKMASVGQDWAYNAYTQIRWGLRYIEGRYTTPCTAWGHFLRYNWY